MSEGNTFILCNSFDIKTHTVKLNLLCAYPPEMVLQHSSFSVLQFVKGPQII